MAGKSRQLSHELSGRKGKQAPVTLNKQWKEGRKREKNYLDNELALQTMLKVHTQSFHKKALNEEYTEFPRTRICNNSRLLEKADALCC